MTSTVFFVDLVQVGWLGEAEVDGAHAELLRALGCASLDPHLTASTRALVGEAEAGLVADPRLAFTLRDVRGGREASAVVRWCEPGRLMGSPLEAGEAPTRLVLALWEAYTAAALREVRGAPFMLVGDAAHVPALLSWLEERVGRDQARAMRPQFEAALGGAAPAGGRLSDPRSWTVVQRQLVTWLRADPAPGDRHPPDALLRAAAADARVELESLRLDGGLEQLSIELARLHGRRDELERQLALARDRVLELEQRLRATLGRMCDLDDLEESALLQRVRALEEDRRSLGRRVGSLLLLPARLARGVWRRRGERR